MPVLNLIRATIDGGANDGKFVLNLVGDDPATDFYVGITGPAAIVVKAYPGAAEHTGATYDLTVDMPVDAAGAYIQGDYIFHIRANGAADVDETETFCLSYVDRTMVLTVVADCYSKSLVITDASTYPTGTVTRAVTVDTPNIPGTDDVADAVYTAAETIIDMVRSDGNAYSNVTYGVTGATQVETVELSGNWSFGYILAYTGVLEEKLVRCDTDACGIIGCVNDSVQALLTTACGVGGISQLPKNDADKLVLIMSNLAMYNYYNQCSDVTNALFYYDKLKTLTGDCECGDQTGPTVIADSSFVYLRGYSAYELWIQDGNTGSLDDFFSSLFPITDWSEVDEALYINEYKQDTTDPLYYRMTKAHIEFKGSFRSDIGAASPTNPSDFLSASFDPAPIEQLGYCSIRIGGEHAGYLYRDTDDKWKIHWSTNFNRTVQQFISGPIPLDGYLSSSIQYNTIGWTPVPAGNFANSHTSPTEAFSFRTDGRYVVFRGQIKAAALVSPGLDIVTAAYWTSVGVAMEEDAVLAAYNGDTKILMGIVKVVGGTLKMFPITDPTEPSPSDEFRLEGIIALQ